MRQNGHKYGVLAENPVGRRPLGKTWHKCRDNIKMVKVKAKLSHYRTGQTLKVPGG
jgi:hypothetical protein